jgi:hypothetical protein
VSDGDFKEVCGFGALSDGKDIHRAWENIKENIKISAKESLVLHELK